MKITDDFPTAAEIKKLPDDGGPEYNRLVFQKSPYLLQHARNPVNWYPWSEEAFLKAQELDRPIFLSIGYSTCHWCHVMEKESFEDEEVAQLLNEWFIPIKVDREERPDIDQIYMSVCQAVTGMGGWPLNLILTPEKLPFFAGTYFPKESRFGRTGILDLLPKVNELWTTKRDEILDSAEQITKHLQESLAVETGTLHPGIFEVAFDQLKSRYDPLFGGFGSSPKFPSAHNLLFLIRHWHHTNETKALEMVEKTLNQMRLGGIYDHVGFGFHRYSTDEAWLLPHFEKMLYDQAMMVMIYSEAYQATGNNKYSQVAREIIHYVLRDMRSTEGGFFSAEDADSEGEEGLFYQWTTDEFRKLLSAPELEVFLDILNLKDEGNFYDEAEKTKTGRNILHLKRDFVDLAEDLNLDPDQLTGLWEDLRQTLFEVREKRIHPLKDDKILTDWNGLMIAALAKASTALAEPDFLVAAKNAVDFVWSHLRDENGQLIKRYRDGEAGQPSYLDDYAYMIWGLLEIYQADFDVEYLKKALILNEIMLSEFWDADKGAFFISAENQDDLIVRNKEIYDGAIPSGNSVAAHNLVRLARITGNYEFDEKAQRIGEVFAQQVNQMPQGYTHLLSAFMFTKGPSFEVVISGNPATDETQDMLNLMQRGYYPNVVMVLNPTDKPNPEIWELSPWLKDQVSISGKATAYVCQDFSCKMPTTDIKEMLELLQ
jgi:uncharacterized protein YyaL (SSP411 family)